MRERPLVHVVGVAAELVPACRGGVCTGRRRSARGGCRARRRGRARGGRASARRGVLVDIQAVRTTAHFRSVACAWHGAASVAGAAAFWKVLSQSKGNDRKPSS